MVGITGRAESSISNKFRLRLTCFRMALSASSAPRFSNLLSTTRSATSSISIFSNCVWAPNSLVITYKLMSLTSVIASLPWPIPLVSTKIRSYPTAWQTSMASRVFSESSLPLARLAKLRMKSRSLTNVFIRIRSPRSAPPVLFRVGSVHSKATFSCGF